MNPPNEDLKAAIYLRTSTKEQNPENQLSDCIEFCTKIGVLTYEVFSEQKSAWRRENNRDVFDPLVKDLENKKYDVLVVWRYDRIYRNMRKFTKFMEMMFMVHGVKVYSVKEEWITELWDIVNSDVIDGLPSPFDEVIRDQFLLHWRTMIKIAGKIGQDESDKRSERTKSAVRKNKNGVTVSYKKKKWGRPKLKLNRIEVIRKYLEPGMNLRTTAAFFGVKSQNTIRKYIPDDIMKRKADSLSLRRLADNVGGQTLESPEPIGGTSHEHQTRPDNQQPHD